MTRRWPNATYVDDNDGTAPLAQRIFDTKLWRPDQPLRVVLIGTDFEVRVWETLLQDPDGPRGATYSDIASKICTPEGRARRRRRGRQEPGLPSSCPATARSARAARSPAITGASPASRRCWAGKPGSRGGRKHSELALVGATGSAQSSGPTEQAPA